MIYSPLYIRTFTLSKSLVAGQAYNIKVFSNNCGYNSASGTVVEAYAASKPNFLIEKAPVVKSFDSLTSFTVQW